MKIQRMDHVCIVVNDLDAAKEFFLEFGMEMMGERIMESELVDSIVGLKNVKAALAMLKTPDGGTNLELVRFFRPVDEAGGGTAALPANAPGFRHIAFAVEDLDAILGRLMKKGAELVGDVRNYNDVYKMCYIRGPEGIIIELAEELG